MEIHFSGNCDVAPARNFMDPLNSPACLVRFDHVASRIVNNPNVPDSKFKRQFSESTVASAGKMTGNAKSETGKWLRSLNRSNALTFQTNHDHARIFLLRFCNLIRPRDMKCAAAIIFVSIAFVSQEWAVLRPLFPAKAGPPFNSGTIITGNDSIQHSGKQAPDTVLR